MSDLRLQVPYVKNLTYEQYNAALLERDAEIEQLRAALKPFAEVPPDSPPEKRCIVIDAKAGPYHFLQSDLDRAKAANQQSQDASK